MSGGRIVVLPGSARDSGRSLIGNAAAYGATGGELFVAGRAGQRFGVRNSAATLVSEGVGKYAFEYMTGGTGAVLGPIGTVVGSGMTGGEIFLLDGGALEGKLHADARFGPLDDEARARLEALLQRFADATGSAIARELLADPARVRRVIPSS